ERPDARGDHPGRAHGRKRVLRAERGGPDVAGRGKRGGASLSAAADRRPNPSGGIDAGRDRIAGDGGVGGFGERGADVRAYAEFKSPFNGIVDTRAVRVGEVVNPGQPIVTLIDPDDLWVRADVEESYIDRVRIGDTLTVRLPSGEERQGTVFYRGADASFATQRDVSRTKRDIKTFEVRLRVDNRDRRLAVGMTAYVLLKLRD